MQCKNAKPRDKAYKMADAACLYLYVTSKGGKSWRYSYKINNKYKTYTYGLYPETTLQEAREAHKAVHKLVSKGIDPHEHEEQQKREADALKSVTFKQIAHEWLENRILVVKEKTLSDIRKRLEKDVFPEIGHIPVSELSPTDFLKMLKRIEARGAFEMANRAKQYCSKILRYGVATGKARRDYTIEIGDALVTRKVKHQPALSPDDIPVFLSALQQNKARLYPQTQLALKMLMLTFVRPIELASMEWSEIDFDNKIWSIPADKMKMGHDHIVPLSSQAIDILNELKEANGRRPYVFVKQTKPTDHMHRDTLSKAVRSLGFQGQHSAHGFRALARTTIREKLSYDTEVIERQLAHKPSGSLGSAYDRTQFIDQRKAMMQDWADYIDAMSGNGEVIKADFKKTGIK